MIQNKSWQGFVKNIDPVSHCPWNYIGHQSALQSLTSVVHKSCWLDFMASGLQASFAKSFVSFRFRKSPHAKAHWLGFWIMVPSLSLRSSSIFALLHDERGLPRARRDDDNDFDLARLVHTCVHDGGRVFWSGFGFMFSWTGRLDIGLQTWVSGSLWLHDVNVCKGHLLIRTSLQFPVGLIRLKTNI